MLNVGKIYILHDKSLVERRSRLLSLTELKGHNITWITGFNKDNVQREVNYQKRPDFWNSDNIPEWKIRYKELSSSELSLGAKHNEARKLIAQGSARTALVLEDDVLFCEDFVRKFNEYLQETPDDWDIIYPGDGCGMHIKNPVRKATIKNPPFSRASESYIIKQDAAKKMFEEFNYVFMPSDYQLTYIMNSLKIKCYWWEPTLISQGTQTGLYKTSITHCSPWK